MIKKYLIKVDISLFKEGLIDKYGSIHALESNGFQCCACFDHFEVLDDKKILYQRGIKVIYWHKDKKIFVLMLKTNRNDLDEYLILCHRENKFIQQFAQSKNLYGVGIDIMNVINNLLSQKKPCKWNRIAIFDEILPEVKITTNAMTYASDYYNFFHGLITYFVIQLFDDKDAKEFLMSLKD